jgi:hypothetical protein
MQPQKQSLLIGALTFAALLLMVAAYFTPIWWVSLTAPNYPPDAFPQGIRIHFHFNGVFNGCTVAPKTSQLMKETLQEDLGGEGERYNPVLQGRQAEQTGAVALDCVHEMNTINHYVGMHPIEIGAPVERQLSKFIIGFFAVMLAGFVVTVPRLRLWLLAGGFAAVAVWMIADLYVVGSLDAYVAVYMDEAGKFFREPDRIAIWGKTLRSVTTAVASGLIVAMVVVVVGVAKLPRFPLLLALVPALLPVFFVIDYAGWLWFFGHELHPWGAFTVKPFMPTVLGDGKVAQFSTHSYPHYGFAILFAITVLLVLAVLMRVREMRRAKPAQGPSLTERIAAEAGRRGRAA